MADDYHYALAEFGPSEVARLTGISPDVQRDWRRRGVIVMEVEGRARFYLEQVCQILLMKAAADLGVPLSAARSGTVFSSLILKSFALQQPGAVDFDPDVPTSLRESASDVLMERAYRYLVVSPPDVTAEAVEQSTGKPLGGLLREMLPLWPASDWGTVARTAETLQSFGGCAFGVIDLEAMAVKLAREAERPLATVRAGPARTRNRTVLAAFGEAPVAGERPDA